MQRRQPDHAALAEYAAKQGGLFTRAQAVDCGFSEYQIRHRRRAGEWITVMGPVYGHRGTAVTAHLRDAAAQLAEPAAVLAGPSAARRLGLDVPATGTYVVVPADRHLRLDGVRVFREPLAEADAALVDGALVTTPGRTVFDCVRVLPDADAVALLATALQHGWTSVAELGHRLRHYAGRRGAPRIVRLLRQAAVGARTASERLAVRLLQRAGIWGWLANEPIEDKWGFVGIGDIVFPRLRLLIELDGDKPAAGTEARLDRERHNRLLADGWTVLAWTWHELANRPDHVVETIHTTLDRLGAPMR